MGLLAVGILALAAAAPDPPSGPSYGARPAHYGDTDIAATSFAHAAEVDVPIDDAVEVFNFTTEPASFEVYSADLVPDDKGRRAPAAREVQVTGPGSWVSPDRPDVEVAPRSSQRVPFTIRVPVGTPPGTYAAALLVERNVDARGNGVLSRTRISLPIELEVLGDIDLGVTLGPLQAVRDGRTIRFELPVTNSGNVTFEASGSVAIGDEPTAEAVHVPLAPSPRTIAPQATATLTGDWDQAPWFGRITAHPVVEAQVGERTPQIIIGDPITIWIIPWWLLITAATALAVLTAVTHATRDRRKQWHADRREERDLVRELRQQRQTERQNA